jgi:hypothetical protein
VTGGQGAIDLQRASPWHANDVVSALALRPSGLRADDPCIRRRPIREPPGGKPGLLSLRRGVNPEGSTAGRYCLGPLPLVGCARRLD